MIKMQLANHLVEIDLQLAQEPLLILGNQYRLEQVILNLLSNAKYAVEEKEKEPDEKTYRKRITIKSYRYKKHIHIVVQDNGIGIAPDVVTKIFNPFFTTKSGKQGTGLGLSISYGIIREMKGIIYVESELNKQTTFTLELPMK